MNKHDCQYFYGRRIETDAYGDKRALMKYCPICGNLTEPQIHRKPLTIKELRKLDGKPVWVECFEYPIVSGYYIVSKGKKDNLVEVWGYDINKFCESNYGGVWVAYEQKHEAERSADDATNKK